MNEFRVNEVLDYIETHTAEWNQSSWAGQDEDSPCGTTCCMAGHAALLNGWQLVVNESEDYYGHKIFTVDSSLVENKTTGEVRAISAVGLGVLELEEWEADLLFSAHNDFEDLKRIVKEIANGEHEHLRDNYEATEDYQVDENLDVAIDEYADHLEQLVRESVA